MTDVPRPEAEEGGPLELHLHRWLHPAVLSAAGFAAAAGFAQFGVSAALGDVAAAFGEPQPDIGVEGAGLAGTTLGLGLAIIRLASLGALPLGALADSIGRKRVLFVSSTVGLLFTVAASLSPSYWWFVAIFALGRPMLSATNALAGVIAAEETRSIDRSKALALIGAAYGLGAGLTAVIRGVAGDSLGFRGLFALALVPLLLLPLLDRKVEEPDRFRTLGTRGVDRKRLGFVPERLRPRLYVMCALWAAIGFVSGPANMFLFYFAESVQGLSPATMALAVLAAGPIGIAGLLAGRWAADVVGRRMTAGFALIGVAVAAVATYNLGRLGVIAGYLMAVLFGAAYAPASGALSAELFPTSVRGTAAGWLTAVGVLGAVAGLFIFGVLVDRLEGFGGASIAISIPVIAAAALYLRLPETKGLELEESAPEQEPGG
jgi:putative MFS transporter